MDDDTEFNQPYFCKANNQPKIYIELILSKDVKSGNIKYKDIIKKKIHVSII